MIRKNANRIEFGNFTVIAQRSYISTYVYGTLRYLLSWGKQNVLSAGNRIALNLNCAEFG